MIENRLKKNIIMEHNSIKRKWEKEVRAGFTVILLITKSESQVTLSKCFLEFI